MSHAWLLGIVIYCSSGPDGSIHCVDLHSQGDVHHCPTNILVLLVPAQDATELSLE